MNKIKLGDVLEVKRGMSLQENTMLQRVII